ncbi:hypothetical protein CEXT_95391, partial [Caerostris extrusa]
MLMENFDSPLSNKSLIFNKDTLFKVRPPVKSYSKFHWSLAFENRLFRLR